MNAQNNSITLSHDQLAAIVANAIAEAMANQVDQSTVATEPNFMDFGTVVTAAPAVTPTVTDSNPLDFAIGKQATATVATVAEAIPAARLINNVDHLWLASELADLNVRYTNRNGDKWSYDRQTPGTSEWEETTLWGVARLLGYPTPTNRKEMGRFVLAEMKKRIDAKAVESLTANAGKAVTVAPVTKGVTAPDNGYDAMGHYAQTVKLVETYPQIVAKWLEIQDHIATVKDAKERTKLSNSLMWRFTNGVIQIGRDYLENNPSALTYMSKAGVVSLALDLTLIRGKGVSAGMAKAAGVTQAELREMVKAGTYTHPLYGRFAK